MHIVLHHPYLAPVLRCVSWLIAFTVMVSAVVLVFASRTLGLSAGLLGTPVIRVRWLDELVGA